MYIGLYGHVEYIKYDFYVSADEVSRYRDEADLLKRVYALSFIVGAFGSHFARYINQKVSYKNSLLGMGSVLCLSLFIVGELNSLIIVVFGMMLQSVVHGVLFPTQSVYVNGLIPDNNRSGVLSLQSLIWGGIKTVIVLISGFIADWQGLEVAIIALGLFAGVYVLGVWIFLRK